MSSEEAAQRTAVLGMGSMQQAIRATSIPSAHFPSSFAALGMCSFVKQYTDIIFYGEADNLFAKHISAIKASSEVMDERERKM